MNIYSQLGRERIIREIESLLDLYLYIAYNGFGEDEDGIIVLGGEPKGLGVKDERVYKAMRRLERDLQNLMGIYTRKLCQLSPGEPRRVHVNEPMSD